MRVARGDVDGAVEDGERALALARRSRDPQTLAPVLALLVHALAEAGRSEESCAYLDEFLSNPDFVGWGLTPDLARRALDEGRAADLLAVLEENESIWHRAAAAILSEDFVAAAELYRGASALSEEAAARGYAAEQLFARGRLTDGEEQLERAVASGAPSARRAISPRRSYCGPRRRRDDLSVVRFDHAEWGRSAPSAGPAS